jgi:uncharacterized membrane protein YjfL (UPF0719 family)
MKDSFLISLNIGFSALIDSLVLLAIMFLGRLFYKMTTKVHLEREITEKDNPAMGVAVAGYLIGLGIAASGGLIAIPDLPNRPLLIGLIGLISMFLLRISVFLNDHFILHKFNNLHEIIENKNVGVAFVEAGSCIATGLMIHGAMTGKADSLEQKLLYGLFYWGIGQILLIIGSYFFRPICGYAIDHELEKDNNSAAGLAFCGYIVALGLIIKASLYGASTNMVPEIATILSFVGIGMVLLAFGNIGMEKILLPRTSMKAEIHRDKNIGVGALSAVGFLCIGIIFAASISPATSFAVFDKEWSSDSVEVIPASSEKPTEAKPSEVNPVENTSTTPIAK